MQITIVDNGGRYEDHRLIFVEAPAEYVLRVLSAARPYFSDPAVILAHGEMALGAEARTVSMNQLVEQLGYFNVGGELALREACQFIPGVDRD